MKTISISGEPTDFYDTKKDDAGSFAGKVCVESRSNSRFVKVSGKGDHFRATREFSFHQLPPGYKFNLGSDGIGTKVVLADVLRHYSSMAADLLAMGLDDTVRDGGMPLVFTNVLDVNSLKTPEQFDAYKELMTGLASMAQQQEIVIISGETASLGSCVSSPNPDPNLAFNRSGAVLGVSHPRFRINPDNVVAGDYIVALKQDGFRSNGISKVRGAFAKKYGPQRYEDAPQKEVAQALSPSVPYARAISEANGWFTNGQKQIDIHGIAHLSGGSFQSKFFEPILEKKGLSATLDNLFPIPDITMKCYERDGTMTEQELFSTWCCGQGMLVIVPSLDEAENFINLVEKFGIEGRVAGQVIHTPKGVQSKLDIATKQL